MKVITAEDRKKIYNILAEAYLDLVEKGLIGKVERKVISKKVLDHVGNAKTYEEVSVFVRSLIQFYPVFHNAQVQVDSEIGKLHEQDVMGRLQQFIRASR